MCYYDGIGVEEDEQKALEWFLISAENGNSVSQYWIALYCRNNTNIEGNEKKSFEWFLKSAENGNIDAQYEVAKCFIHCIGVEANEQKSFEWFLRSAENKTVTHNMRSQNVINMDFELKKMNKN